MSKTLWAAGVNLSGLYSKKPVALRRDRIWNRGLPTQYSGDGEMYWDKSGNLDIDGPGLHTSESSAAVWFSSFDKAEVRTWISGAKSMASVVRSVVDE